jgi:hypothetical protein
VTRKGPVRGKLGDVIGTYKAAVTRTAKRPRLWQRGYYDHVVRDDDDLARIREYIATNPMPWGLDPENPAQDGARCISPLRLENVRLEVGQRDELER